MSKSSSSGRTGRDGGVSGFAAQEGQETPVEASISEAISIVQRGNLKALEKTLRKQCRMGQNIVLCWSANAHGLLVILVPHIFLGNYCVTKEDRPSEGRENEAFIRELISGERRMDSDELFKVRERLGVSETFIKLSTALSEEPAVLEAVEQIIKRYGLSYVESRAVLLFDIVDFSLYTPFEQASQLNSLSYSMNSSYTELLAQGIEINFARTTTGDGYYVWNRDLSPKANQDLFIFMLLVVANNFMEQAASRGNTIPVIRTGFHIGGHYELYQAEGVNPSVFSYIVGDVTIELARMLDIAQANQVVIGEFKSEQAGWGTSGLNSVTAVSTISYINACNRALAALEGIPFSGGSINSMSCQLTETVESDGNARPRRFLSVDKHNLSHYAYNLEFQIDLAGKTLALGLSSRDLPALTADEFEYVNDSAHVEQPAPAADVAVDDLASMLKRRKRSDDS